MVAMTIRELMTYMAALPADTYFPVGLGMPFVIGNNTDQVVFRPRLGQTAEQMHQTIDAVLGTEITTTTGGRAVINAESSYAYFGVDPDSTITGLNIVVLTFMRAMERGTKTVRIGFSNNTALPGVGYEFTVPAVWWSSLSNRHKTQLAAEYVSSRVLSGMNYTTFDSNKQDACTQTGTNTGNTGSVSKPSTPTKPCEQNTDNTYYIKPNRQPNNTVVPGTTNTDKGCVNKPAPKPDDSVYDAETILIEDPFGRDLAIVKGFEINTVADDSLGDSGIVVGGRDIHFVVDPDNQ